MCRALDDPKNSHEQTAKIVTIEPALAARLLTPSNTVTFAQIPALFQQKCYRLGRELNVLKPNLRVSFQTLPRRQS